MKILVTGAKGFIGKNFIAELENNGFKDIYRFTKDCTMEDLDMFTKDCDFVFHFAGVNRPKNNDEFMSGNVDLTKRLLQYLRVNKNKSPVLFSSSILAINDSHYGRSKNLAEELLFSHSEIHKSKVMIYRLPNLFGKWGKPNYNSVVSTFCNNVANGLPIVVNDKESKIMLNYIDDVVQEFIKALNNKETRIGKYCVVQNVYETTIGELVKKIVAFKRNRETLIMPPLETAFDKSLYSTYLSYLEQDKFSYELKKHTDDRGWLAEFMKSESMGQLFISRTKPGITRGNHWHHSKVEKFLVVKGQASIKFRKVEMDSIIEYLVDGDRPEVVDIPAGYTHSIENIGEEELITLFWSCEIFNPQKPDTYFMEV